MGGQFPQGIDFRSRSLVAGRRTPTRLRAEAPLRAPKGRPARTTASDGGMKSALADTCTKVRRTLHFARKVIYYTRCTTWASHNKGEQKGAGQTWHVNGPFGARRRSLQSWQDSASSALRPHHPQPLTQPP